MHSNFVALILILVLTTNSITSVVCNCGDSSRGWKKMAKQYVCHEEKEPCQVKIMRVAADLEFQRMFSSLANFENAFVNFIIQFMIFHKFELGNSMIDSQYLPHTFSSPCPNWSICLLQNSSFVQITDFTNQPLMAISQKAILTIELLQSSYCRTTMWLFLIKKLCRRFLVYCQCSVVMQTT